MKKALKILAVALLLAAAVVPAQAQRRVVHYLPKYEQEPYHFGFLLAFNEMMYTVKTIEDYQNKPLPSSSWPRALIPSTTEALYVYNIETKQKPGFTVGIIGSKRLGRYFDLRFIPTLSFCDRELIYDVKVVGSESQMKHEEKTLITTFVEFPLNIKYRSKRYNNIGAYLMGGINPKIDLASQKNLFQETYDANGNVIGKDPVNFVPKRFDCAAEIGVGYDFYNQWFKMGIEIKMSYGLLDIVKETTDDTPLIYTAPIDKLRNKMFQISMLIE
ncbi:MAG: PorT family protein [Bacteroidales bacterium]|nr:PorT family protein [Bacteroidales bacterium]